MLCESISRFIVEVLSVGPMPQHVAIIMDGNRRYAQKHGISVTEAHTDGYFRLTSVSSNTILKYSRLSWPAHGNLYIP